MMISKSKIREDTHYIEFIDTLVPKLDLADFMIRNYEKENENINLMPREFIEVSIDYWFYHKFYHCYAEENYMDDLNTDFNICELKDEIRWQVMYDRIERYLKERKYKDDHEDKFESVMRELEYLPGNKGYKECLLRFTILSNLKD